MQPLTSASGPDHTFACFGQNVTLSTLASGVGPFDYQWTLDGNAVGTNGPSLTVPTGPLSLGDHAVELVVSGQCGPAVTNTATLTVQGGFVANGPDDAAVCQGTDANFLSEPSGTAPFTFQWSLDGVPVGTNATLTVPTGALAVGNHTVQVIATGQCAGSPGTVTNTATLTVQAVTGATVPAGAAVCQGANASFSTVASGVGLDRSIMTGPWMGTRWGPTGLL